MAGVNTAFKSDIHANRPAHGAGTVLYFCTTHNKVEVDQVAGWADLFDLGTVTPSDAELAAIAALTSANNKIPYFTGSGTAALLTRDTDGTLAANSDTNLPTQKAVKTYVDNIVTGLFDFKGSTDASGNPNYPAASKGDAYVVSVAGKIGGGSGVSVDIGDVYVASADNAGGTQAGVGASWFVLEHNLVGAVLQGAITSSGLTQATAKMLGRSTAGSGAIEEIAVGSGLSLAAGTLSATGGGGSPIEAKDEGSSLDTAVTSFDFVGAGVTATNVGHAITVTIAGGAGATAEVNAAARVYANATFR